MANNSANVQSLLRELEALKALNDFLVTNICDRLSQVAGLFCGYITIMAATGVPVQECEEFISKYYLVDENNFKNLIGNIKDGDLPMIRKYIDQIVKQLGSIGYNIGSINLRTPSQSSSSVPNIQTQTGRVQDYVRQLNALCNFMDFLVGERNELLHTIKDYQDCCNKMLEWGVPRQVMEHYVQNFARTNVGLMNKTTAHIQTDDYVQLSGLFREIHASLTALGISYSRTPKSM